MTRKYPDPSPPQGQLDLEPFALASPLKVVYDCWYPTTRHTQDQYRCNHCGVVWDIDEPRPTDVHCAVIAEGIPQ